MTDFIDLATDVWPFALILGAGVLFFIAISGGDGEWPLHRLH